MLRRLQKILEAPGLEALVEVAHYNINNKYMFNRITNGSQTILIIDIKPRISFSGDLCALKVVSMATISCKDSQYFLFSPVYSNFSSYLW